MALRAENLVSYQVTVLQADEIESKLVNVDTALSTAGNAAEIANLRTRRRTLRWQAVVRRADTDFQGRRYDDALRGYQQASQMILALIDSKVGKYKRPRRWPGGAQVTDALIQVSAGMLNHLVPETRPTNLVLTTDSVRFNPDQLGTTTDARVEASLPASDAALSFAERATGAAEGGRWDEASSLYNGALRQIKGQTAEHNRLRAEILLNLGAAEIQRGKTDEAVRRLTLSRKLFEETGDELGVAEALHNTGLAELRAGKGEQAAKTLDRAKTAAGKATLKGLLPAGDPSRPGGLTARPRLISPVAVRTGTFRPILARPDLVGGGGSSVGDTTRLAETLGSHDLTLTFRAIDKSQVIVPLKLSTPTQERHEEFERKLTLGAGDGQAQLTWNRGKRLTEETLVDAVYRHRAGAKVAGNLGFRARTAEEVAADLPHLYHLVLPIKMGDCHHHLGEFEQAQEEYRRAAGHRFINLNVEAPDLWRRLALNVQEWGDSLYRKGDTEAALPIYQLLMDEARAATDSFLYRTQSLQARGQEVSRWLDAVDQGNARPDLNPALTHILHTVRLRWEYLRAGLDFFGHLAAVVSPFTFRYLQEVARYFAQRAIQAEQRYIEFYTRFESGKMTRQELGNAKTLAEKEADAAAQREDAARATVDLAEAGGELARTRHENAGDMLDQFNSVAGQLESLAGHIARGNAWTGSDLPNLDYSGPGYHFDDDKHKVLQQLTKLQTQISNDLQRQRLESTEEELQAAIAVADAQEAVAEARLNAAEIETEIAEERARQTDEMLDAFNNQFFNPEQWLFMALVMRSLSNTALDRAIEVARLMQTAYNFEHLDRRDVIRDSYRPALTHDLLGGELLLSDVDSYTHYRVTRVKEKPIPVKWALSLSKEFPGQFIRFANSGRLEFDVGLDRVALAHPGTYRHLLVGAELEIDGFLPPTGLHGRLTNSGLGRYRADDGSSKLRLQPAETLVLSRYDRRQDSLILAPPTDMRNLFEGNSVASGWLLEVPRAANDVDLRLVFDMRLVLYFECLFDRRLFAGDSQPAPGLTFERSRVLHLRQHFPDAYYTLREGGQAALELVARDFPFNQQAPVLRSLSLAAVGTAGADLAGTDLTVSHPGAAAPVAVSLDANQAVAAPALPVAAGSSALGTYELTLDQAQLERKDSIDDLLLILDYRYTPAT